MGQTIYLNTILKLLLNMSLNNLIQDFEAAKQKVEPLVRERKLVLPIFRVEHERNGHFLGDGFFYASPNKLAWKYGGTGHNEDATPQNLLESYKHYKQEDMTMEDALTDVTQRLNEWYEQLQKK